MSWPLRIPAVNQQQLADLAVNSIVPSLSNSYQEQWMIKRRLAKWMAGVDIDITPTKFFDPTALTSAATGTLANPYYTAAQVQAAFTGDMKQVVLGMKRGTKTYGGLVFTARGGINYPARIVPYGNSEYLPELIGGALVTTAAVTSNLAIWKLTVAANQDLFQNGFRLLKRSTTYASEAAAIADLVTGGAGTMGYMPSTTTLYFYPLDSENPNLGQFEVTSAEFGLNFIMQNDQSYAGNVLIAGLHCRLGRNNGIGTTISSTNNQYGFLIDQCAAGQSGVDVSGGYASSAAISVNGYSLAKPLTDWGVTRCFVYDALNNAVEQIYTTDGRVHENQAYNIGGNSIFEAYLACKNTDIAYNVGYYDMVQPSRLSIGAFNSGGFSLFGLTTGAVKDADSTANVNNYCHHNLIVNAPFAITLQGGANTKIEHNTFVWDRPKTNSGTITMLRGIAAGSGMTGITWTFNRNMVVNVDSTTLGKHIDLQATANALPNPTTCDYNAYMSASSFRATSGATKFVLRNLAADSNSWIVSSGFDTNSIGTHDIDSNYTSTDHNGNYSVMDTRFKPTGAHPVLSAVAGPNLGYTRDINGVPLGPNPIAGCYAGTSSASNNGGWNNGTITNDNAAVGVVGELVTSVIASGSAVSLTTATTANVTSISLTAGDWDVTGVVDFHPGATTVTTYMQGGVSTVSATIGAQDASFLNSFAIATTSVDPSEVVPVVRMSLAATTTVYLVAAAGFTVSTLTAYGTIRARRVR